MINRKSPMLCKLYWVLTNFAGGAIALASIAIPVPAAGLEDLYRAMMTIKACEMTVTEVDWDNLTSAIEEKISMADTSSEAVNLMVSAVNDEMRDNLDSFCAANVAWTSEIIAEIL